MLLINNILWDKGGKGAISFKLQATYVAQAVDEDRISHKTETVKFHFHMSHTYYFVSRLLYLLMRQ